MKLSDLLSEEDLIAALHFENAEGAISEANVEAEDNAWVVPFLKKLEEMCKRVGIDNSFMGASSTIALLNRALKLKYSNNPLSPIAPPSGGTGGKP